MRSPEPPHTTAAATKPYRLWRPNRSSQRVQPLADAGIELYPVRRAWDEVTWPLATRGFFSFAERIPELLRDPRLFPSAAGGRQWE
jgi:hypothetical protein